MFKDFLDFFLELIGCESLQELMDQMEKVDKMSEEIDVTSNPPYIFAQTLHKPVKEKPNCYDCYYQRPKHLPYMRRNY